MRSRKSEIAVQLHLKQWAEDIRDCRNRPENVTVKQWCEQYGITKLECSGNVILTNDAHMYSSRNFSPIKRNNAF